MYLPLDPAYPSERLDFMASDAGAALVLDSIHGLSGDADLPAVSNPNRLAYIIYTSGTTGLPKGVAVGHAAPVNMAFARRACHDPLGVGDRVIAAISVGFDVSIGQLLLPLLSGAAVVIAGDVKAMGASEFWALAARRRVTHMNSVPSFLDSILDAAPAAPEFPLKRLMLGGEALSGILISRSRHALPKVEVVNMYGPTEACIDATYYVAGASDVSAAVLPIGRPLSNYQAYVLDSRLEPVGVGVSGELYLGGAGLAHGYLNAPELTAERFIADPFSVTPGARLYRTGDRTRWSAEGQIEFLGRVDRQVKIRGFRIEPAEIESQLRMQPGVREAAVVATGGVSSRLIAYYAAESVLEKELRAAMAAALPDYMVPSAFIKLDRLPLSPNGKLDRKALLRDVAQPIERAYEAPLGADEEALQRIFQRVLGVQSVSRGDNFFELGGNSLGAMRLVSALNAHFEVSLPMRVMFEYPSVGGLAIAVRLASKESRHGHLLALQPARQPSGTKPNLFCIHPAGGHVFCYLPLVRELGTSQPVFGLQASGLEEGETLGISIEQMATSYIEEIQRIQPAGPYHLLGMSSGGLIAYEMVRQIEAGGEKVNFLALLDTTVPGSLSKEDVMEESSLRPIAREIGCEDLLNSAPKTLTLAELVNLGRSAGRLPADFNVALAERVARVYHNTVRLYSAYQPAPSNGPILLLRALQADTGHQLPDWSPFVTGQLEVVDLDCGHADLLSPALAPDVAALVASRLSQVL